MARFDLYIPYLTNFEGGYVNDPLDRGGETNMGLLSIPIRAIVK